MLIIEIATPLDFLLRRPVLVAFCSYWHVSDPAIVSLASRLPIANIFSFFLRNLLQCDRIERHDVSVPPFSFQAPFPILSQSK